MANQYDTNLKLQAIADALGAGQSSELVMALEDIKDAIENGGGGGTGGGIKQLLIYDGSNDPIGQLQSSIVLDEEWDKYDYLVFEVRFGGNDNAYFNGIVSTDTLTLKIGSQWVGLGTFGSSYVGCSNINSDKKTLGLYGSNVNRINRVYGLKFYSASGTGATASDISYNHSSSGLSANNVQDAIDENATAISTLNSNIGTWEEFEITPHTGFTAAAKKGYYNATLGLVKIEFYIYGGTASANDFMGTIPAQYRPTATRNVMGSIYTNQFIPTALYINSNGNITQITTTSNISQCLCVGIYTI